MVIRWGRWEMETEDTHSLTLTKTHSHPNPITWAGCPPAFFMERWGLQGF